MFEVTVRHGSETWSFALPADHREVTIGAARDNDWVLPCPGVSRHHAVGRRDGEGLRLRDLGSKNGLRQGGRRLAEALLQPGAEVGLGQAQLRLEDVGVSGAVVPLSVAREPSAAVSAVVGRVGAAGQTALPQPASTVELLGQSGPQAAGAILLLQELVARPATTAAARQRQLERLLVLLGARSVAMMAGGRQGGLSALAGRLPAVADAELLEHLLAVGGNRAATADEVWLLAPMGRGGGAGALAAALPADAADEPWRQLTLLAVAQQLAPVPVTPPSTVATYEVAGDPLRYPPQLVVGASPAFQELLATLRPAVVHGDTFLVLGETGTGKELIARLIHASKPGAPGPFVACNVAALPPDLLESELFGIGDRVATGVGARPGLFEQAQGGSIFLDEIGELPPALQAKILRVLQEREVHPIGRGAPRSLSLRVIAATNQDLRQRVADGAFRADLYYRLERVVCQVPSLRQRREDIPSLALALVDGYARAIGKRLGGVRGDLLARVAGLDWPGNVRQLENVLQEAVRRCPTGAILDHQHLRPGLDLETRLTSVTEVASVVRTEDLHVEVPAPAAASWSERHDELERDEVRAALAAADGVFKRAAEILGLTAHGLRLKRRRLGLG